MKKNILIAVVVLFSLSACVPGFLGGGDDTAAPAAEAVDIAATVDAEASTQAAQTLSALATPTEEVEPTEEPTATATETLAPTEESDTTETPEGTTEADETPDTTETVEVTPEGTETPEATATPENTPTIAPSNTPAPTATSVYPSPTSPIAINLPPENLVPRHKIEVQNNTQGPVYISLQGSSEGGYRPIVEYDIPRFAKVRFAVPEGYYTIVVYVGKEPMVAYTGIYKNNALRIVINRKELIINKD